MPSPAALPTSNARNTENSRVTIRRATLTRPALRQRTKTRKQFIIKNSLVSTSGRQDREFVLKRFDRARARAAKIRISEHAHKETGVTRKRRAAAVPRKGAPYLASPGPKKGYMTMAWPSFPPPGWPWTKQASPSATSRPSKPRTPFAANDIDMSDQLGVDVNGLKTYGSSLIFGHPQAPTAGRLIIEGIEEVALAGVATSSSATAPPATPERRWC